jgi:hypothetical protein
MRLGRREKMSLQGVQIDMPSANDLMMEKIVFQMTYQRNVSRKKSVRSMRYMMVSAKAAWLVQSPWPRYLSWQFWTFIPTMTLMGSRKERVRKKYDSVNLHPNTSIQRRNDAARGPLPSAGYDAVNVWLARYFRLFPATRSPNILPDGSVANVIVATTEQKNWTIPRMSDTWPDWFQNAM